MSETAADTSNRLEGLFSYTQKGYWGAPWYPYWTLIVLTVVGGFFGLDHFWLRSPTTGILKLIINVFGLGIWYLYDILQIFSEKDSVMKYGLTAPVVGPLGIGAGMFTDNQPGVPVGKSPFRWLAYTALAFLPFGFELLVAGDWNGAFAKFMSSILFFLWPIAFIWTAYTVFQALFNPTSVWEKGTTRLFPFSYFMDPYGPSMLGPRDVKGGMGGGFFSSVLSIVQTFLPFVAPGVVPAVAAVGAATTATARTVEAAADTATGVIEALKEPVTQTVSIGTGLVKQLPAAAAAIPAITSQVGETLRAQTTPEAIAAAAIAASTAGKPMIGGGLLTKEGTYMEGGVGLGVLGILFAAGAWTGFSRLNKSSGLFSKQSDGTRRKWDDSPPKPHGL